MKQFDLEKKKSNLNETISFSAANK